MVCFIMRDNRAYVRFVCVFMCMCVPACDCVCVELDYLRFSMLFCVSTCVRKYMRACVRTYRMTTDEMIEISHTYTTQ